LCAAHPKRRHKVEVEDWSDGGKDEIGKKIGKLRRVARQMKWGVGVEGKGSLRMADGSGGYESIRI